MEKSFFLCLFAIAVTLNLTHAQPWANPLMMAWSDDGVTFSTPSVFQDSSGVPSAIRWKGDTLICAFQWARQPVGSSTWDRVAVKFSYDGGESWTEPQPIVVNGFPVNYQRPFDPTLALFSGDSIRIYFSSSDGMPPPGQDSIINTYSAKSGDGINYLFEPNPRVDHPIRRLIDPAVIWFNNAWHYESPKGAPQEGAFHYVSPDGIHFSQVPDINSDPLHNWTGNYMVNAPGDLRFYGSAVQGIWYNSSVNGGIWSGYVNTNLIGGDPTVVKVSADNYLAIYTGQQYAVGLDESLPGEHGILVWPNPVSDFLFIQLDDSIRDSKDYSIFSLQGVNLASGKLSEKITRIQVHHLNPGPFLLIISGDAMKVFPFIRR